MPTQKQRRLLIGAFIFIETILYLLIMVYNNKWYMFISIALCLLYSLLLRNTGDRFTTAALSLTLAADFFLVLCPEQYRVWGMVFFLGAQTLYATGLQVKQYRLSLLLIRIALAAVALLITVLVLKDKTDALALISLCYYANLLMNITEGFIQFRINKVYPIGMLLFALCDTVIGLQVMASAYIPLSDTNLLYQILYSGLNLAWFFYLPSQVLLAISGGCNISNNKEEVS